MLECWAFRLLAVYFALDALPDLVLRLPRGGSLLVPYWKTWNAVLPWFGAHILHLSNPQRLQLPVVSVLLGDFTGAYVLMLVFLVLAVIVATIWTLADQQRSDYRMLHGWLRVYVRYALAFSMLGYGISKLVQLQFRPLDLVDLMTPVGVLQPRELLWAYMGFSSTYQIFAGVVECLGVALLFFRRTVLLGALVLIGSLTNILVIDIAYGVSVRRIVLRFLLMALFLAAADWRRLMNLFVLHRAAGPVQIDGPSWQSPTARRVAFALKAVIIIGVVTSVSTHRYHERVTAAAPRPELYGVYTVRRVTRDGRAELPENPESWRWIGIDAGRLLIESSGMTWQRRRAEFDDVRHTITLPSGPLANSTLAYSRDGDSVLVAGMLDGKQTKIVLRRVANPRFLLQGK